MVGTITKLSLINDKEIRGALVGYDIENYGCADYWIGDETVYSEKAQIRQSRSMMPKEYVYKSASDFRWDKYKKDMTAQKRVANAFILKFKEFDREGRGLYIHSKTKGSGKTFLACCIANEVIKRYDVPVKFITVPELIELIKSKADADRALLKSIYECTLLILDDIGAESSEKSWITGAVFRLVDARNRNTLSTIYTSNYSMTELPGDERTTDRIIGHSIPFAMPEISVRKQQAEKHCKGFLDSILGTMEQESIFDNKNTPQ